MHSNDTVVDRLNNFISKLKGRTKADYGYYRSERNQVQLEQQRIADVEDEIFMKICRLYSGGLDKFMWYTNNVGFRETMFYQIKDWFERFKLGMNLELEMGINKKICVRMLTGQNCPVCGKLQWHCIGGMVCEEGHGF